MPKMHHLHTVTDRSKKFFFGLFTIFTRGLSSEGNSYFLILSPLFPSFSLQDIITKTEKTDQTRSVLLTTCGENVANCRQKVYNASCSNGVLTGENGQISSQYPRLEYSSSSQAGIKD